MWDKLAGGALTARKFPWEEVWDKLAEGAFTAGKFPWGGGGVGQASRGSALTAGKFPWGGGVGQTLLSPSAPRGKVGAGGSILVVVRDWKLCVETEILLWEKGRKE